MKIVAIINQKGGVGKTACAYNIAYCLAQKGFQTLLIDLDPSANTTKAFNLREDYRDGCTLSEALIEKEVNPKNAIHQINTHLGLIPSRIDLAIVQRALQTKFKKEVYLSKMISRIEHPYDYILLDCCPTLSELTINAIMASNSILTPISYEEDAIEGLLDLGQIIDELKEATNFPFRIVRNQKDRRKTKTNDYIEKKLTDLFAPEWILDSIVHQDEVINHAKMHKNSVFTYAPHSNAAKDFKKLTEELIHVF